MQLGKDYRVDTLQSDIKQMVQIFIKYFKGIIQNKTEKIDALSSIITLYEAQTTEKDKNINQLDQSNIGKPVPNKKRCIESD